MDVYFDNAATTRIIPEVRNIMLETMDYAYGNPSSVHIKGVDAEKYIRYTREVLSKALRCMPKEVIFTSGGSEANNTALFGICEANKRIGNHIITTAIEHASVYNPILQLEKKGYRVSFLPVDSSGVVDVRQLEQELCRDTILVSVMAVNNEIGSVQPIKKIADVIQRYNCDNKQRVLFHVDAIQAFGKYHIYPGRVGIDAMSISGHKFHGPKGSGALFLRDGVKCSPLIYGGGQENGMRSGTENVTSIAGLGKAAEVAYENLDKNVYDMMLIKKMFLDKVLLFEGITNNSGEAPHILSLSFDGIRSEVLLHALEDNGIYVSAGSACSSNHPAISGVLKAIQLNNDLLESTLRFSFCEFNTEEEVNYTLGKLEQLLPTLRRFTRK